MADSLARDFGHLMLPSEDHMRAEKKSRHRDDAARDYETQTQTSLDPSELARNCEVFTSNPEKDFKSKKKITSRLAKYEAVRSSKLGYS